MVGGAPISNPNSVPSQDPTGASYSNILSGGSGGLPVDNMMKKWGDAFRRALPPLAGAAELDPAQASEIPPISQSISMAMQETLMAYVQRLRINPGIGYSGATVRPNMTFSPSPGIIARDLMNLVRGLQDFRQPLKNSIITVILPSVRENFAVEGRPRWAPLSPYTIARRARYGGAFQRILVNTGSLERAATSFAIWTVTPTDAFVDGLPESVWYGIVQQEGQSGKGANYAKTNWWQKYQLRAMRELGLKGPIPTEHKPQAHYAGHLAPNQALVQVYQNENRMLKVINQRATQIFNNELNARAPRGATATDAQGAALPPRKPSYKTHKHMLPGEKVEIPSRPFLTLQEQDVAKIMEIFYYWLDDEIVKRGNWVSRPT